MFIIIQDDGLNINSGLIMETASIIERSPALLGGICRVGC